MDLELIRDVAESAATTLVLEGASESHEKLACAAGRQMRRWGNGILFSGVCRTKGNCGVCSQVTHSNCGFTRECGSSGVAPENMARLMEIASSMLPPDYLDPSKNSAYLEYWDRPCNSLKNK